MHFIPETLSSSAAAPPGLFISCPRGCLPDLGAQGRKISAEVFAFPGLRLGMLACLGEFLLACRTWP